MRLNNRKISIFFIFLSWLAICSSVVFAQHKTPEQKNTFGDFHSDARQTESETEKVTFPEKSLTDEANTFPESNKSGKNIFINGNSTETIESESPVSNKTDINDFAYHFRLTDRREKRFDFKNPPTAEVKEISVRPFWAVAAPFDKTKMGAPLDPADNGKTESFHWRSAVGQSLMFLAIQHGYAFTQPKTREAIKGKFWKDYVDSVKSLHGWDDGGRFFTNYIAHPMQGAFTGFIQIQNDPRGLKQQFGTSKEYWQSRLKAMAWSAAWSTQFEIGPISQASIGNVGLKGKQTWGDIVVTPTVGTALLVSEDAVDRFVMRRIERSTDNFYVRIFARMLLSPTRTIANLFRFKEPWYRDRPLAH